MVLEALRSDGPAIVWSLASPNNRIVALIPWVLSKIRSSTTEKQLLGPVRAGVLTTGYQETDWICPSSTWVTSTKTIL